MTPARVGRYELQEVLGTGGFATVYKAVDPRLDAVVAVKVLAENWSHQPEVRRRFRTEAVLLRRVQSESHVPGIVEVFDIDESEDGRPFFVMSYADRGTLSARSGTEPWTPSQVVPVIDSLTETIGALHASGVVHRDLKPSNLMLRSDRNAAAGSEGGLIGVGERMIVGDLGLAKDLNHETTTLSLGGGTQRYMAPEQIDPTRQVDGRADVYASSVLVMELLTGRGSAPAEKDRYAPESPPAIAPEVWTELQRGFADDADARHPSMAHWRHALVSALVPPAPGAGLPPPPPPLQATAVTATGTAESVPTTAATAGGRSKLVVAGLVALGLLLLIGIGAAVLLSGDGADPIVGPESIEVGETVRYRVEAEPDSAIVWTDWNGARISNADLQVTPVLPGILNFSVNIDGERSSRSVEVRPSPVGPSIEGPETITVGTLATFTASAEVGDVSQYWLDPAGVRSEGPRLLIEPTQTGDLSIALVSVGADGVERGVRRTVEVDGRVDE